MPGPGAAGWQAGPMGFGLGFGGGVGPESGYFNGPPLPLLPPHLPILPPLPPMMQGGASWDACFLGPLPPSPQAQAQPQTRPRPAPAEETAYGGLRADDDRAMDERLALQHGEVTGRLGFSRDPRLAMRPGRAWEGPQAQVVDMGSMAHLPMLDTRSAMGVGAGVGLLNTLPPTAMETGARHDPGMPLRPPDARLGQHPYPHPHPPRGEVEEESWRHGTRASGVGMSMRERHFPVPAPQESVFGMPVETAGQRLGLVRPKVELPAAERPTVPMASSRRHPPPVPRDELPRPQVQLSRGETFATGKGAAQQSLSEPKTVAAASRRGDGGERMRGLDSKDLDKYRPSRGLLGAAADTSSGSGPQQGLGRER